MENCLIFDKEKTPGAIDTTSLGARGADSQIRTGDLILTKELETLKNKAESYFPQDNLYEVW